MGVLLGGLGAAVIVDPSIVKTSTNGVEDEDGGSEGGKRALGVGVAAVGGLLLVSALVDVIRASGTTEYVEEVALDPTDSSGTVQCPSDKTRYANGTVHVTLGEESYEVGKTNARGLLDVDLDDVIDAAVIPEARGRIAILVDGNEAAQVSSAPLFKKRERRAWASLRQGACMEPVTATACDPFVEFLAQYPDGAHAAKARAILEIGQPETRRLAEANAWAELDTAACATGSKSQDIVTVESACALVESFLRRFADGAHAGQASDALEKGKARIARLQQQQRAVEAGNQQRANEIAACRNACKGKCAYATQAGSSERSTCERNCATAPCPAK